VTSYEQHCLNLLIGDAVNFLTWILARNGEPAHINNVPINFNSYHWISRHPDGPLHESQQLSTYRFTFTVTDAGMKFLRDNGWKGDAENPPLDPSQKMPAEEKKALTSVWLLDRNRQIHEWKDLSRVPTHVVETLKDNDVAVIDGQLYAVSFEHLMGTEDDPTLSVQ
jgi:hypothetical protein